MSMTRGVHILWLGALTILGALAFVGLWSDVWEAYLSAFIVAGVLYGVVCWKKRRQPR